MILAFQSDSPRCDGNRPTPPSPSQKIGNFETLPELNKNPSTLSVVGRSGGPLSASFRRSKKRKISIKRGFLNQRFGTASSTGSTVRTRTSARLAVVRTAAAAAAAAASGGGSGAGRGGGARGGGGEGGSGRGTSSGMSLMNATPANPNSNLHGHHHHHHHHHHRKGSSSASTNGANGRSYGVNGGGGGGGVSGSGAEKRKRDTTPDQTTGNGTNRHGTSASGTNAGNAIISRSATPVSVVVTCRREMYEMFQTWALKTYGDSAKTKTVTRKKYNRILKILKGEEQNNAENSKFRFWVKAKGFRMGPPPGHPNEGKRGEQVLYVPCAHVKVKYKKSSYFCCFNWPIVAIHDLTSSRN